ncbi:MAG TPA: phosphate ABC transporter substrate-binding protein [Anaerolineaceae bacterium]|nr:phosphate ABC transporter substrate-binding protein [Anaerolineaceae bacterium]
MRRFSPLFFLFILFLTGCQAAVNSTAEVNAALPIETIENKGSDTIVNLALAWAEAYQKVDPHVAISVTGGGTGTGITALINGTVDIANASRRIKDEELSAALAAGYDPQEFIIARDAIAIIVNPQNPVDHLTPQQLSAIYKGEINNWSELGGDDLEIVRLSRETNSGTHVYFLESVIRLGNPKDDAIFSADTLLLPSSEGIIAEVKENPHAIGYDSLGYITDDVKMVAISSLENPADYVLPSIQSVNDNSYVISRDLYIYTLEPPAGVIKEYIDWLFSPEAQQIVRDLGFVPILKP